MPFTLDTKSRPRGSGSCEPPQVAIGPEPSDGRTPWMDTSWDEHSHPLRLLKPPQALPPIPAHRDFRAARRINASTTSLRSSAPICGHFHGLRPPGLGPRAFLPGAYTQPTATIDVSVLYCGLQTPSTPHRYGRAITQIDPPPTSGWPWPSRPGTAGSSSFGTSRPSAETIVERSRREDGGAAEGLELLEGEVAGDEAVGASGEGGAEDR